MKIITGCRFIAKLVLVNLCLICSILLNLSQAQSVDSNKFNLREQILPVWNNLSENQKKIIIQSVQEIYIQLEQIQIKQFSFQKRIEKKNKSTSLLFNQPMYLNSSFINFFLSNLESSLYAQSPPGKCAVGGRFSNIKTRSNGRKVCEIWNFKPNRKEGDRCKASEFECGLIFNSVCVSISSEVDRQNISNNCKEVFNKNNNTNLSELIGSKKSQIDELLDTRMNKYMENHCGANDKSYSDACKIINEQITAIKDALKGSTTAPTERSIEIEAQTQVPKSPACEKKNQYFTFLKKKNEPVSSNTKINSVLKEDCSPTDERKICGKGFDNTKKTLLNGEEVNDCEKDSAKGYFTCKKQNNAIYFIPCLPEAGLEPIYSQLKIQPPDSIKADIMTVCTGIESYCVSVTRREKAAESAPQTPDASNAGHQGGQK